MPDRRTPRILSVLLSEDLRTEETGLQTVVGLITGGIVVATLPIVMPKLVIRVEFETSDNFTEKFHLAVVGPKTTVLNHAAPFAARSDVRNVLATVWTNAIFPEAGRYSIKFWIEGHQEREVASFAVQTVANAPQEVLPLQS